MSAIDKQLRKALEACRPTARFAEHGIEKISAGDSEGWRGLIFAKVLPDVFETADQALTWLRSGKLTESDIKLAMATWTPAQLARTETVPGHKWGNPELAWSDGTYDYEALKGQAMLLRRPHNFEPRFKAEPTDKVRHWFDFPAMGAIVIERGAIPPIRGNLRFEASGENVSIVTDTVNGSSSLEVPLTSGEWGHKIDADRALVIEALSLVQRGVKQASIALIDGENMKALRFRGNGAVVVLGALNPKDRP